jgi:uncharacterized protein YmfQ (DUF2313 family)
VIPRSPDAALGHLLAHMPPGWVWPREADSNFARTLAPLAHGLARLEADAAQLQVEATGPREAVALLDAFERVLGGDPCALDLASLRSADRQAIAHTRWIARGGQSPAYFVSLAAALGTEITITEQVVTQCGWTECGEELTPEGEQFIWIVNLPADRLIDTECGVTECGDALGDIAANIAECVLRTGAPAHTRVVFNYV